MKKFLFKALAFFMAVTIPLLALSFAWEHSRAREIVFFADDTDKFYHMPETIDIAAFGNSHSKDGLLYAPAGHTMFNFALNSQTLEYDYMMMRQYQDKIEPGAIIVLTFSYTTPYAAETEKDFQSKQGRYYRLLDAENIIDIDWPYYYLQKYLPVVFLEPYQLVRSLLVEIGAEEVVEEKKRELEERAGIAVSEDELPALQERIKRVHVEPAMEHFPNILPECEEALQNITEMAQENGWQVVIVTLPYLAAYNECFPPEFYPEFAQDVAALSAKYGVPYLDYSHDAVYAERLDWYCDLDHFNITGAKTFDEQFFGDLKEMGLLE